MFMSPGGVVQPQEKKVFQAQVHWDYLLQQMLFNQLLTEVIFTFLFYKKMPLHKYLEVFLVSLEAAEVLVNMWMVAPAGSTGRELFTREYVLTVVAAPRQNGRQHLVRGQL